MASTKSLFFSFMYTEAFLDVYIESWQFRRGGSYVEVVSPGIKSSISVGTGS